MHKEEKRYGKKALILVSALTMAMTATVGGTVAWLVAKTDKVTNTFTYGDINIELEETDTSKTPNDEADQGDTDNDPNNPLFCSPFMLIYLFIILSLSFKISAPYFFLRLPRIPLYIG